ncbi:hypothetical protein CHUAL_003479 [Chamberlinius hualienensis]
MLLWSCFWIYPFFLFGLTTIVVTEDSAIDKNLKYYEVIRISDIDQSRVKRSTENGHELNSLKEMQFQAFGREFRLMLTPRKGILSNQFRAFSLDADGNKVPVSVERNNFYEGRVDGEVKSDVSMHYEDGLMTATIRTPEESYVVEPAWRHLGDNGTGAMIAYRTSDINYSWDYKDFVKQNYKVCGFVREGSDGDDVEAEHSRQKRQQSDGASFDPAKSRCPLLLVADYRFYQNMGGKSEKSTINYLVSLLDRVHKIYMETSWRDGFQQSGFKDMGFVIEEINVHRDATPVSPGELHYNMARAEWNVRDLLEVFSREKSHQSFCLAHLFTDIKFEGGILGLAYVGSSRKNSVGGICSPEYFKNGHILYLNSGLSSSRNHYGQRVITREADLVTAHEFGHNWGSEHDPDTQECSPNTRDGGSYLMYTFSVRGYDHNNKCFSPCSLRSIRAVLMSKSNKCFKEPQESFCGNSRVEAGEECDAGLLDGIDTCCEHNCTLKRSDHFVAKCSDKNSPCCRDCQYMPRGFKCRESNTNTCEKESICNGKSAECPASPPENDGRECIDKGKCFGGECRPFCATIGKISCMCEVLADSCKRCCRTTYNTTCLPVEPVEILPDGTPCIYGLCNLGICEKNIQLDIVERFWDIIEDININTLLKFLNDNIVGTVIVISLIFWIPASCLISYIDRKRRKEALRWRRPVLGSLSHVAEPKKIIRVSTRRSMSQKDPPTQWTAGPRMRLHEAGPSVATT